MQRFGTQYAGFWYPSALPGLDRSSVLYCVGVGEDVSHDVALSRALGGCELVLIDPTPRALAHVDKVRAALATGERPPADTREGGGDPSYWAQLLDAARGPVGALRCVPCALDAQDGERLFYPPKNPAYVSHSFWPLGAAAAPIAVPCRTLDSVQAELGHARIDLLKLDIEGAELGVLGALLQRERAALPKYLAVEFDSARLGINGGAAAAKALIAALLEHYVELRNDRWNISFVRRDLIA